MDLKSDREILQQAIRFPSLDKAAGIMPWYPNQLDAWASDFRRDFQAVHAARFLLHQWNPSSDWECGHFDVGEALKVWDRIHRRAFLESVTQNSVYSLRR